MRLFGFAVPLIRPFRATFSPRGEKGFSASAYLISDSLATIGESDSPDDPY